MSDDGAIYEGRRATGRFRHQSSFIRRIGSEISQQVDVAAYRERAAGRGREALEDFSEQPELAHPGEDVETRVRSGMSSGIAKAAVLRNVGKHVFLSVVKETVDLVALEAASKALQEEMDEQKKVAQRRGNHGSSEASSRRVSSGSNAGVPSRGTRTDGSWISGRGGAGNGDAGRVNGGAVGAGARAERQPQPQREEERSVPYREPADEVADQERSMLLGLLSGAYNQINELTDELQLSLQKLNETEVQVKELLSRPAGNSQHSREDTTEEGVRANGGSEATKEGVEVQGDGELAGNSNGVKKVINGLFATDEGANSTPATVRQLQEEVQRLRQRLEQSTAQEEKLRQRVAQANAKEEKQRGDLARNQRLMAVMESQINDGNSSPQPPTPRGTTPRGRSTSSTRGLSLQRSDSRSLGGAFCVTPGGTRYQDGVTRPLVDRVTELEAKLVKSSMENATAKQDYLTMKLRNSQLEKSENKLRRELARSEQMNDLLQNEIDRLQGISPEEETDGKGWRRWLGGVPEPLQEPLSPQPLKVASGDCDSPVVVVRDLDNNQLVYAPGRAEFM